MPVVKPFKAVRPAKNPEKIASLPYDVISDKEAREEYQNNPLTFFRIGRSEILFDNTINPYSKEVYQKSREVILEDLKKGVFLQEEQECFYIYQQQVQGFSQIGLVTLVSAQDYEDDIIKKHELTREDKEKDRFNHINLSGAHAEPVFLAYQGQKEMDALIKKVIKTPPLYDFNSPDKVKNTLWKVEKKEDILLIQEVFKNQVPTLYIADGHHRAKASCLTANYRKENNSNHTGQEPYNFFMAVLFSHSQLRILPYNRVVKTNLSMQEIIEKVKDSFKVEETNLTQVPNKGQFLFYAQNKSYLFTFTGKIPDNPEDKLDVALLQNLILDPVLGIKNPRTSQNIDFVGGIKDFNFLKGLVDSKEFQIAIALYPTSLQELFEISDAGKIMPPKSTWFEPKLKSGLFLHLIDQP